MRNALIGLWMLLCPVTAATAQVSVGIGLPGLSIGFNLPYYPQMVPVPGYPVYYAPQLDSNFFFYDGMYWVYQQDNWYAGSWYNGPWALVGPEFVPLYVLRIPVRYYRRPPVYFRGWRSDLPPRWGEHWGNAWETQHSGWDRWNHGSVPALAPLPVYQRQYSGDRYPHVDQQSVLQSRNYRYQPREVVVQQHYQQQGMRQAPAAPARGQPPERQGGSAGQQNSQQYTRPPSVAPGTSATPRSAPPSKVGESVHGAAPAQIAAPPKPQAAQQERMRSAQQSAPQAQPQPQAQPKPQSIPKQQSQSHDRKNDKAGEHGQEQNKNK